VPPGSPSDSEFNYVFRVSLSGEETAIFSIPESNVVKEFFCLDFGSRLGVDVHKSIPYDDLSFRVLRIGSRESVPDDLVTLFLDGFLKELRVNN